MAVIVVLDLQPREDADHGFVADTLRYFRGRGATIGGRANVYLAQDADAPSRLLYVATWDSLAAYQTYLAAPGTPRTDERLEQVSVPRYFEPLRTFEVLFGVGSAFACVLFEGTPEQAALREAEILSYAAEHDHYADGVVRYAIGRETDQPGNHLLVMQYKTAEHYARVRAAAVPTFIARLLALGCTYRRFYGQTILELDRANQPTVPASAPQTR
jgi:quinol monooxygenase YgiN